MFLAYRRSFYVSHADSAEIAETMRIGIVLCRELRRDARYACVTIWMESTNKVCALLRKSAQSA